MGRGHESATTRPSVGMYACQRWGLKFSDESYIGYKNKTSRAIGSYKRSKSAIVLPSDNKSNVPGGSQEDDLDFPDKKQLQPSWNSEWVLQPPHETNSSSSANLLPKDDITRLSHQAVAVTTTHNRAQTSPDHHQHHRGDSKDSVGDVNSQDDVPPVRPARPSVLSRQGTPNTSPVTTSPSVSTQSSSSSSSQFKPSVSSSPHLPDSTTSTGTPVFTARPFVISQTGRMGQENSPRRAPPPVPNSPPFNPNADSPLARVQPPSGQSNNHSNANNYSHQSPSSSSFMSPSSSLSSTSSSPQQRPWQSPDNTSMQWSNSHNIYAKPSHNLPVSSHVSNANSNSNIINSNNVSILNNSNAILHTTDNQPPSLPPPREKQQHRRESDGMKLNSINIPATNTDNNDMYRRKSEGSVLESPRTDGKMGDNVAATSGHTRQPSQEELECDLKAKQLAEELGDKEVKLSEVLSLDTNKKRMRYMDGLFSETAHNEDSHPSTHRPDQENTTMASLSKDATVLSPKNISVRSKQAEEPKVDGKRPSLPKEYWLSASKAQVEMALRHSPETGNDLVKDIKDEHSLVQQKEELLKKLRKKLDVLEEDKVQLIQEIEDNNSLGLQVNSMLASRCNMSVVEKYKAYVEDQDKIVRLLLNLSGQLARAENAVEAIPFDADSKLKKLTIDKRERLHNKHEDAKNLKADIDKRKDQVSSLVQEGLGDEERQTYVQFINKKPQLTIELQELEDKIKLGTEQMEELKKSIPNS